MNMKRFQVDVKFCDTETDKMIIETDSFREAINKYDELRQTLLNSPITCEFDLIIMYIRADTNVPANEQMPIVLSSVETKLIEF